MVLTQVVALVRDFLASILMIGYNFEVVIYEAY